jgi:hypothetical protein
MAADRARYREIAAATARLLADGSAMLPRSENPEVFDVSLVAGHAGVFEVDRLAFDNLMPFVEQALHELQSFDVLETVPPGRAHLTIFPLFQNKPRSFGSPEHAALRAQQYEELNRLLAGIAPLRVRFEGLCLAPTGAVLLQGFCGTMEEVRLRLSAALPDPARTPSQISHVTLARLRRPATHAEFRGLSDWCAGWAHLIPGALEIVYPKLVATGDQDGTLVLQEEMRVLSGWNQRIPSLKAQRLPSSSATSC